MRKFLILSIFGLFTASVLRISSGGTGATTQAGALKNITPDTTGKSGKFLGVTAGGGIGWNTAGGSSTSSDIASGSSGNIYNRYTPIYGYTAVGDASSATVSFQSIIPYACTIKNLYVKGDGAAGSTNGEIITVYKNGTATTLSDTIKTVTSGSNTTATVSVNAGDYLQINYNVNSDGNWSKVAWGFEITKP